MGGFAGVGWVAGGSGVIYLYNCGGEVDGYLCQVEYKHTIYKKGTIIQVQIQIQH